MSIVVSMLRGVNLAQHHRIKMDALRAFYESLGLETPETYLQSGNVIFKTRSRDLAALAGRIETEFERTFGFRADVVVRTPAEMRDVVARNPFAGRPGIHPGKLAVTFLARDPGQEACAGLLQIKTDPEELRIDGREIYIYFPNGMGRSKLPWARIAKILGTTGTARNWNTVRSLAEAAEKREAEG